MQIQSKLRIGGMSELGKWLLAQLRVNLCLGSLFYVAGIGVAADLKQSHWALLLERDHRALGGRKLAKRLDARKESKLALKNLQLLGFAVRKIENKCEMKIYKYDCQGLKNPS